MKNDLNYAVIFKKVGKGEKLPLLVVDSVAQVKYDSNYDKFSIMTGEYEGKSSDDFSILGAKLQKTREEHNFIWAFHQKGLTRFREEMGQANSIV